LHWINGPWKGKFALSARPRGGDWLSDEIAGWRRSGINSVFSTLTDEEMVDLDLSGEPDEVQRQGMKFRSFPIPDRQVPDSEIKLTEALDSLASELERGNNAVIHCRQGIGRTGLVAACLLIGSGADAESAVSRLSAARGLPVPETPEQRKWIDRYASWHSQKFATK
jgi:protein-tyrosine phosphatase